MTDYQSAANRELESERIVQRLALEGLRVGCVYDLLREVEGSYAYVIPALLELLPTIRHDRLKEGIIRALTDPAAATKEVGDALLREFELIPGDTHSSKNVKWAVGNAMSVIAQDSHFDQMVRIIQDRPLGWVRRKFPLGLARTVRRRTEAIELLRQWLEDPDLVRSCILGLGVLRATEALPDVRRYVNDKHPQVAAAARKVAKMMERRSAKP